MKPTYNQGYVEGIKQTINTFSKEPHCQECGGQAHGQTSFALGYQAAKLTRYRDDMLIVLGTVWWSLTMLSIFMLSVHIVGGTYMKAVDMMRCSSLVK